MQTLETTSPFWNAGVEERAQTLFEKSQDVIHRRTDHMFAWLMICQWVAGIAAALWISPRTWLGATSQIHWHVWAAIFFGGAITWYPVFLAWKQPGRRLTRHVIAAGQMLTSALLIHLTGGRIETHFHVFGSLAFLAFYRDWRVLVTATVVVAADHFLRGVYWPQSVFGVLVSSHWRWIEHAAWVLFEDFFLFISVRQSLEEMLSIAKRQATLEAVNAGIERQVAEKTADLRHLQERQELVFRSITEGIHWIDVNGRIVFENRAACTMLGWNVAEIIGQPAHLTMHHSHADGTPHPQSECPIYTCLHDGETRQVQDDVFWRKDGSSFPVEYTATPVRDKHDAIIGVVVVFKDVTARKEAEQDAALLESRFQFIFGSVPVGITWMIRGEPDTRLVNLAHSRITGVPLENCHEMERYRLATHPEDRNKQDALHQQLVAGKIDHYTVEKRYVHPDGVVRWTLLTVCFYHDKATGQIQEICTLVDITDRKKAEGELERVHKELMEASRRAGMTEVATSVLHNVGNVLNSVNVSATLVADQVRNSKISNLAKVNSLLREHDADLAAFLATDQRGRQIPGYLVSLAEHLAAEQGNMLKELESLRKNMEHIKEIVTMQQNYSKVYGIAETLPVVDLVEDALRMNAGAFIRHDVTLLRDYQAQPTVTLEKHKVLQILVNLMRNAKYACDESGRKDKQMKITVSNGSNRVKIAVVDNGVGIPQENLARIFAHGFTTRKDGHGYGLHSGALAARDLGGSLTAYSDGLGKGATFILELPFKQEGIRHE